MSDLINRDTVGAILCGFYADGTETERNLVAKVREKVMAIPAVNAIEVQMIPSNPEMDNLLKEAGWE